MNTQRLSQIIENKIKISEITDNELIELVNPENGIFEVAYRKGEPLISDHRFDHEFMAEAIKRFGEDSEQLAKPGAEPDNAFGSAKKIKHPRPMLSSNKAYEGDGKLDRFLSSIEQKAYFIGINKNDVVLRATPKLDGLAGRYENNKLVTRGNHYFGYDITYVFDRGIVPVGGKNTGLGELVVDLPYFENYLSEQFEHPRNFMVGLVGADEVATKEGQQCLNDNAARFVPYSELPSWTGTITDFVDNKDSIWNKIESDTPYLQDGLIVEAMNPSLRDAMGSTSHHYKYMIALKKKGETADTIVKGIVWQTGRTGVVTPVVEIEPTKLSMATIRRVTAHNAGNVKKHNIGTGSSITIIRSGEVIPKIEKVNSIGELNLPDKCPSCGEPLTWESDFLVCTNHMGCQAQKETSLVHFFRTLGNVDLFGPKSIEKIVNHGISTLEEIYNLETENFQTMGFGDVQAANLVRELNRSKTEQIEDWRFLAAFGIKHLGKGDSRKLLSHHPIESLKDISKEKIISIDGFGELTSGVISKEIESNWSTIEHMLNLGFKLEKTPSVFDVKPQSAITNLNIVFTGSMQHGSRDEMKKEAISLGAKVQSSVNSKTNILVCGEKVGQSKLDKAAKVVNIRIMSESEYLDFIN